MRYLTTCLTFSFLKKNSRAWAYAIASSFLFCQCSDDQDSSLKQSPEPVEEELATYHIEGLDDDYLEDYKAYTRFDTGYDSDGDTISMLFTTLLPSDISIIFHSDEAFRIGTYRDTPDPTDYEFFGSVEFDNINTISDTATLIVKEYDESRMLISLDIFASTNKKRYRIQGKDIVVIRQDIL